MKNIIKTLLFTLLLFTLLLFTMVGCAKKETTIDFDPFLEIQFTVKGAEGKGMLVVDYSKVVDANIKNISSSKLADDKKSNAIANLNALKEQLSDSYYTPSKSTGLQNDDEVIITFGHISLEELGIKPITTTYTYKVTNLENIFTLASDLTDEQYTQIQDTSLQMATSFLAKISGENKKYSKLVPRGIYLIPNEEEPDTKAVLCVFSGVERNSFLNDVPYNKYVYPFVITKIDYDQKGRVLYSNNIEVDYITTYYQPDDIPYMLSTKNFEDIETVKDIPLKKFKSIDDIPNDFMEKANEMAEKELEKMTLQDSNNESSKITQLPTFHGAYILTMNPTDLKDDTKKQERKSLVLLYDYAVQTGDAVTQVYYFKEFNYFLYDENGVLIDYNTINEEKRSHKLTDEELKALYTTNSKGTLEPIPF